MNKDPLPPYPSTVEVRLEPAIAKAIDQWCLVNDQDKAEWMTRWIEQGFVATRQQEDAQVKHLSHTQE